MYFNKVITTKLTSPAPPSQFPLAAALYIMYGYKSQNLSIAAAFLHENGEKKRSLITHSCSDLPGSQLERIRRVMSDRAPNAATDKLFPLPRFNAPEVLVLVEVGVVADWVGGGLVVK